MPTCLQNAGVKMYKVGFHNLFLNLIRRSYFFVLFEGRAGGRLTYFHNSERLPPGSQHWIFGSGVPELGGRRLVAPHCGSPWPQLPTVHLRPKPGRRRSHLKVYGRVVC